MRTLVSFDIETTGLDPKRDSVIEIGAVKFRGSRVEDTYSSLINPGSPLPPLIESLTGISDAMLAGAPRFQRVLPDIEAFVGDCPILGHSVRFDVGFMNRWNLFKDNETLDTFDLASVMLPTASRYNLVSLAQALQIPVLTSHRALDDAETTRQVFLRLFDQILALPFPLLEEISRFSADVAWGGSWVFDTAYDLRVQEDEEQEHVPYSISFPKTPVSEPKPSEKDSAPFDIEEIVSLLEPGGPFAQRFEGYEHRPQQVTMTRAVAEALSESKHLLVEAGTGTGKSMAYLVPAFAWASQNAKRVVISTNTLNLQDQLVHKDAPDLNRALNKSYRAAVLKGRGNYVCPRRLNALRQLGPRSPEEVRVLAKLLVWLSNGGSGDRSEINLPLGELGVWTRLSADDEDCSMENCVLHMDGACPYYQARQRAETADVVIVNHALLLADIVTGNRVIPEYEYLIVDEAHHLESATTNGMSFKVTEFEVLRQLRDLGGRTSGLLAQIRRLAKSQLPEDAAPQVESAIRKISDRTVDCTEMTTHLFEAIKVFVDDQREGKPPGPYGVQYRILPSTRTLPLWEQVEIIWDDLRGPLGTIVESLLSMSDDLTSLTEAGIESAENLAVGARIVHRSLSTIYTNLENMIFEPDSGQIYWIRIQAGDSRLSLHAAPLEIGSLVERFLWHEKESVIMTSATLTTAGEFDFIRGRLKAYDADEFALGSPFDFESSTLLYLVNDIPEPADRGAYQRVLEHSLKDLFKATSGRGLVLFTSNVHLRTTARAISEDLGLSGIQVFEQTSGASRHFLLESFRTTESSVLLGTRSFWEGIDVPGPALSVLGIVRLPFDVPNDPIIAARSETYESPFQEYTIPEAILRFRQGFGRLIRTKSDRGVVVIFDRRILSKRYGRAFIDSLPRCTIREGSFTDLPDAAAKWIGA